MNRHPPPDLVATTPAEPCTESPPAHPPIWHYGPDIPIIGSNGMGVFGFYLVLLLLLPGYGLAMLLMGGLDAMQGATPGTGPGVTASLFILPLIGSAVLTGVFFAWFASAAQVQAFTFDANQQLLTLTVTRRGRKPTEVRVAFDDILYIRPYVVFSSDRNGHFRVVYQGPNGKVFEYELGDGTSLKNLEFHAQWFRGMMGDRVHELLNLDK